MEAVGQLTGGIAHDFNNLLAGIVGSLDLMQTPHRARADGRHRALRQGAMSSAQRAAALTHRLLAFSRRQPLDPKPVDANQLVAAHGGPAPPHARRRCTRSSSSPPAGCGRRSCDPNQLESAILNLAINARDAMPEGGKLTIETSNAHLDDAYAAAQPRRDARAVRLHLRHRHRHRHAAGRDRARLRAVLHDEADRPGHRPRPVDGLRLRQAVARGT